MEHRSYSRIQTSLPVIMHIGDIGKFKCRIRNISEGGILLEQESATLSGSFSEIKNTFVNIEFDESTFSEMLPALVLRDSGKYAALMFTARHPAFRSFLLKLKQQNEMTSNEYERNNIEVNSYIALK